MGFRQKSRGIRFGFLEYLALLLLGLTCLTGFGWWSLAPKSHWVTMPARVYAASLVENTRLIEASRPTMQIHFDYVVGGHTYRGVTRVDRVTRALVGALPKEVHTLLHEKGYLSFKDLPPELQAMLRRKGVATFDQVPGPVLDLLRAQGYKSIHDFPEDVERLLREGNYEQAADLAGFSDATLARLRAQSTTPGVGASPGAGRSNPSSSSVAQASVGGHTPHTTRPAQIPSGNMLHIRYDPEDPSRYEVVRMPFLASGLNMGVFLTIAILTLVYCGVVYPHFKQT